MYWNQSITQFLFSLRLPFTLPKGIEVLDVHQSTEAQKTCTQFYNRFYNDANPRHLLIGINPGRFGGGVTGIPFTDPIRLQQDCGIPNAFTQKQELSSVFMYEMMKAFGSVDLFYRYFYISSVSPLGFVRNGKNLNYYDDAVLMKRIEPFAVNCMQQQLNFGLSTDIVFCIGEGDNLKYLQQLNAKHQWFGQVIGLPHPRFIMQYKLQQKSRYIQKYVQALQQAMIVT